MNEPFKLTILLSKFSCVVFQTRCSRLQVKSYQLNSGLQYFLQKLKAALTSQYWPNSNGREEANVERRPFIQGGCGETLWSYNQQPKQSAASTGCHCKSTDIAYLRYSCGILHGENWCHLKSPTSIFFKWKAVKLNYPPSKPIWGLLKEMTTAMII